MDKCAERGSVVCERWMDIALTSQQRSPLWCDRKGLRIITAVGTFCSEVVGTGKQKHMVGSVVHRRNNGISVQRKCVSSTCWYYQCSFPCASQVSVSTTVVSVHLMCKKTNRYFELAKLTL